MFPVERYELIVKIAKEFNFVPVKKLAELTKIPLTTLRRDINFLSEQGKIEKTRGGVLYKEPPEFYDAHSAYMYREQLFHAEKAAIGKAAQQFIRELDVILLLNGTTTSQVAQHLDPAKHVTIITNGIDIVAALREKPNVQVILLGGVVSYSQNTTMGPTVLQMLDKLHPSKMITGAGGITEEMGITAYDFLLSSFDQVIEKIHETIVVADYSKFGQNMLVQSAPLNKIHTVITNKAIPMTYIKMLEKYQVKYVLA